MGADGLLGEDGLHRIAMSAATETAPPPAPVMLRQTERQEEEAFESEFGSAEPVLTAEELRALLAEQPVERE